MSLEGSVLSEKIRSFRDLRIWQKGMGLVEAVYQATGDFPKMETYGLAAQMQQAAVSIPSNIAEGFRRKHSKEYRQFLSIALGSCGELETQLEIAKRLGYLKAKDSDRLFQKLEYLCKMTQTLRGKL